MHIQNRRAQQHSVPNLGLKNNKTPPMDMKLRKMNAPGNAGIGREDIKAGATPGQPRDKHAPGGSSCESIAHVVTSGQIRLQREGSVAPPRTPRLLQLVFLP